MLLSAKTPMVAVDIGTHSVKVAEVVGGPGKYGLTSFQMMPLEYEAVVDGMVKKPEVVVAAIRNLIRVEKIKTVYCSASVAGEAVIIKRIKVPVMTREELSENISKEAEQYIPFDIEDVALDFQMLGSGSDVGDEEEGKMEILIVAVQKDIIDNRIDTLKEAGLKPRIIDLDAFAAANALCITHDVAAMDTVAVLDLGASFTHINIMRNGVQAFAQDIPGGGLACTQKLMTDFKLDYAQAEAMKRGVIPPGIETPVVLNTLIEAAGKVMEEVMKSFEFFGTTNNAHVGRAFLTGGGALLPGMAGLVSSKLGIPVEVLNPLQAIKMPKGLDRQLMDSIGPLAAVVVGLAIRKFDYR